MTRLTKLLAVVLVLAALLLAVVAYQLAVAPKQESPTPMAPQVRAPEMEMHAVVVALRAIKAGEPIAEADLQLVQWPVALVQGFQTPSELNGKSLRRDLAPGEPVTKDIVMTGLAQLLEPGERAVSLAIDEVMVGAAQVMPGDFVDVFFTLDKTEETPGAQARLLYPRLKVLTFGAASIDGPSPETPTDGTRQNSAASRTATLAVPLAFVNDIILSARSGRLQLVLRSPKDDVIEDRSLFPERAPVLAARNGLTPEQRAALGEPANRAFAGDSLVQLSNAMNSPARPTPVAAPATPRASGGGAAGGGGSIQIWRGGKPEVLRY